MALAEIFTKYFDGRPHPYQSLEWGSIRDAWGEKDYNEWDFIRTVKEMVSDGTLIEKDGKYSFTELAVDKKLIIPPEMAEIEEAILKQFRLNECGINDDFPMQQLESDMLHDGFTASDFDEGYKSLLKRNILTKINNGLRLTQHGMNQL